MNHGRVGHSCDGLIRQGCCSPNLSWVFRSGVYPCRRIATPSCILLWGCYQMRLMSFILVMPGRLASSLSTDRPGDMGFYIEGLSGVLIGVPMPLR